MTFVRKSGKARLEWYPKKASTAIGYGALTIFDGLGYLTVAISTSLGIVGVCMKAIASTDSDYASTTKIPVDVVGEDDVFEADVTGTLTAAMVGTRMDLSTGLVVNAAGTSHNVVTCVGYISATKGLFKVNARASSLVGA